MKQFRMSPRKLILPLKSCLRKKEWHSKHRPKSWLIWFPDKIQNTRGRKTDDYKFGDKRALQQDWTHSGSSVEDYRALSNFILSEVSPSSSRQETVRKPSMLVEKKLTYDCPRVRLHRYKLEWERLKSRNRGEIRNVKWAKLNCWFLEMEQKKWLYWSITKIHWRYSYFRILSLSLTGKSSRKLNFWNNLLYLVKQ